MRRIFLASVMAIAITSPAAAQDSGPYVGVEGGVMFPQDMDIDGVVFRDTAGGLFTAEGDDVGTAKFGTGFDLDLIGGYDFGLFRIEAELGHKRVSADDLKFDPDFVAGFETLAGVDLDTNDFNLENRVTSTSLMLNALIDVGSRSFGAYAGGGLGRAWVNGFDQSDSAWAWQVIAGVRTAISESIDVGLKYRYFRTGGLDFTNDAPGAGELGLFADGRFSSHSLLASLIFNFGAPARAPALPPAPPPPPPAPPATQTCPDGTVILATEFCPAPPPPPPPPPPAPERG